MFGCRTKFCQLKMTFSDKTYILLQKKNPGKPFPSGQTQNCFDTIVGDKIQVVENVWKLLSLQMFNSRKDRVLPLLNNL